MEVKKLSIIASVTATNFYVLLDVVVSLSEQQADEKLILPFFSVAILKFDQLIHFFWGTAATAAARKSLKSHFSGRSFLVKAKVSRELQ